jgi:hypothetical protein
MMSHTALDALEARVRELERKLAQVEAERDAFILEVRQQWERLYRGEPNDR